jgi:predicted transcriptional regulator
MVVTFACYASLSGYARTKQAMMSTHPRQNTKERGHDMDNQTLLALTTEIVSAHASNNSVASNDLPSLIQQVHSALAGLGQAVEVAPEAKVPVISVRASVKPDYIVCMECGKKQKMLKRHLLTAHSMSPDQYRADYGLPASYPMVAETYSDRRRELAKALGLGRRPGEKREPAAAPNPPPAPPTEAEPRGRRKKAADTSPAATSD